MAPSKGPLFRRFYQQRQAAKRRGIGWELEFWEWHQIWQDSGHLEERGRIKGEWVMARPGDVGPYAAGNVKIVRCETNVTEGQLARWANSRASKKA